MPSLVITGHPCIGKTTFSRLFADRALRHPSQLVCDVIHISESTACPDQSKADCYRDSSKEKITRAALKSEFDRAVMSRSFDGATKQSNSIASVKSSDRESVTSKSKKGNTLVILDSLNYIKGYRYELYCISKAAGERHGVIWIMGSDSDGSGCRDGTSESDKLAKKRNNARKNWQQTKDFKQEIASRSKNNGLTPKQQGASKDIATKQLELPTSDGTITSDGYFEDDETIDALVRRFEPPDDRNRWEKPLYKVDLATLQPWDKDGTLGESQAAKIDSKAFANRAPALKIKAFKDHQPDTSSSGSSNGMRKSSSSGFRRTKKPTHHRSTAPSKKFNANVEINATSVANVDDGKGPVSSISSSDDGKKTSNTDDDKRKIEDVIDEILNSFLINIQPLKEGLSTVKHISAESNTLNRVDNISQSMNSEILKAQKSASISAGVGGKIFIQLQSGSANENSTLGERRVIELSQPLYVNDLRNFRRRFLKWIASHPMPDGTNGEDIAEAYISFIETQI